MSEQAIFDVFGSPNRDSVKLKQRRPGALVLDAARLDQLIGEMLTLRAAMRPSKDLADPGTAGQQVESLPARRLYVSRIDAATVHIMLGHPALGWVGIPIASTEWERLNARVMAA